MKICFIGLGSIASRHIENIKKMYKENVIIDVYRSGKGTPGKNYPLSHSVINHIYYSFNEVPNDYDAIFITNPTSAHYDTLKQFHSKAKHFFIEKPVFDDTSIRIEDINLRKGSIYYVACPLRYTGVIRYLKEHIDFNNVFGMRCISSSYLPNWRPNIDYRDSYSAHKNMGGGVSIDLIHEWDYIQYFVGFPEKVFSLISKVSNLEIDSDDVAVYIAKYSDKIVELHLDYFGRKDIRQVELFTKDETIIGDLINNTISFSGTGEVIKLPEERDDYQSRELKSFLDMINSNKINTNDIKTAMSVLKLAKGEY